MTLPATEWFFSAARMENSWRIHGRGMERNWVEFVVAGPSARGGIPSMAYDTDRKKVVLFGGWNEAGPVSDIWEWDGTRWAQPK